MLYNVHGGDHTLFMSLYYSHIANPSMWAKEPMDSLMGCLVGCLNGVLSGVFLFCELAGGNVRIIVSIIPNSVMA